MTTRAKETKEAKTRSEEWRKWSRRFNEIIVLVAVINDGTSPGTGLEIAMIGLIGKTIVESKIGLLSLRNAFENSLAATLAIALFSQSTGEVLGDALSPITDTISNGLNPVKEAISAIDFEKVLLTLIMGLLVTGGVATVAYQQATKIYADGMGKLRSQTERIKNKKMRTGVLWLIDYYEKKFWRWVRPDKLDKAIVFIRRRERDVEVLEDFKNKDANALLQKVIQEGVPNFVNDLGFDGLLGFFLKRILSMGIKDGLGSGVLTIPEELETEPQARRRRREEKLIGEVGDDEYIEIDEAEVAAAD